MTGLRIPTPNERVVEVPWLLDRLAARRSRRLLDVGAADAAYTALLPDLADAVTLLDVRPFSAPPGVTVAVGPAQDMPAAWACHFDTVVCVSTLDHVGLDAYGQQAEPGALEAAAAELWRVTALGGRLLLTLPVGRDLLTTHPGGGQRVCGGATLRRLFPFTRWAWAQMWLWRFDGAAYRPAEAWADVADAGYLEWRAEAVACMELTRV